MSVLQNERQPSPRMVIFITREEDKRKLDELFERLHMPICYQVRGKGTAPSEMLDILGLSGTTRLLTAGLVPRPMIAAVMKNAAKALAFHKKGGGIALTVALTGMQSPVFQLLNEEGKPLMEQNSRERTAQDMAQEKNNEYSVIWVSVASGRSDEVVDAARAVGAKGGTVLHGRQRNTQAASEQFGFAAQEERDYVMMVVPRSKKNEIMAAIGKACGLTTEAHGVILSLPVEDVFGLET